jgi:hypothetical protein
MGESAGWNTGSRVGRERCDDPSTVSPSNPCSGGRPSHGGRRIVGLWVSLPRLGEQGTEVVEEKATGRTGGTGESEWWLKEPEPGEAWRGAWPVWSGQASVEQEGDGAAGWWCPDGGGGEARGDEETSGTRPHTLQSHHHQPLERPARPGQFGTQEQQQQRVVGRVRWALLENCE